MKVFAIMHRTDFREHLRQWQKEEEWMPRKPVLGKSVKHS